MDVDVPDEQSAPAAELEASQEVSQDQAEKADDGGEQLDEQSTPEAELVEVERNGKKYAIPKELQADLLRQDDFTRKTQEVAETRKALEQQQQLFQQAVTIHRENQQAYVAMAATAAELGKFQNVDWNALTAADPAQAQQAFMAYQTLRDRFAQQQQFVQQREHALMQAQHQARQESLRKGLEAVRKEIPGFDQKTATTLFEQGRKEGFSESRLENLDDPLLVKLLWKAHRHDQMIAKAQKPTQAAATPANVIRAKTSTRAPEAMSTEDWMKWRSEQAKRR